MPRLLIPPLLALVAGCQTGGSMLGGAGTTQPPRNNKQFVEDRRDERITALETSVAALRNEINDIDAALNRTLAGSEAKTHAANADTRAEIAALRDELAASRRRVDGISGVVSNLLDEREKKITAFVNDSIKASEQRLRVEINRRPTGGGSSFTGQAYEHIVQTGETLSEIAQAYTEQTGRRVTANEIIAANNNIDPTKIRVGQKILVPKK